MTEKTDYENLYELILACPKFELQHIIKKYDKFFDSVKYLKNFKFESKAKNFSKLSKHLLYIKELKNEKVDEKIWQILINRLESVYKKEFYDEDEVNKIYAQINSLCDNANEDNGAEIFMPFFEVLLTMFEFKSEVEEELRVKFERCIKDYFEFPPYMKKMLDITGLAGEENYINDITTRIKGFIEEPNYEALLTLVVIHHGSDFFKILKDFENTIESEQIKNDVFGLGSFFSYSKTEYFITCYKETEKEYLSELKLGALEYENEANNPQSLPYLPIKGPECSRWYPNAFDHIRGKTPVWLILYEVLNGKIFSKTGRWGN
uniref:Uncharacterized protein n=1 Tax=Meloidogyne hapla TaxID=6305 RepID=A0A1I8BTQ0_MELHA